MLRFTSCQAPVAEAFCAGVARFVGEYLGIAVEFVDGIPWQERLSEFDAGRIHVCWMCGLPYVWRADRPDATVELLAALVPAEPRYAGRAVYFSDVVVRRDSPWWSFAELEGRTWAYNEETSHSGYNATRHRLAQMGRDRGFFGRVWPRGATRPACACCLTETSTPPPWTARSSTSSTERTRAWRAAAGHRELRPQPEPAVGHRADRSP